MLIPGKFIAILTFPGVIIHEWAHKIACDYVGLKVYSVKYFSFSENADGWVNHEEPRSFREAFIVSFAPFVINTFVAIFCFAVAVDIPYNIIKYVLYYIGIACAMNAFPSWHDLDLAMKYKHRLSVVKKIFVYPIFTIFYIANALSVVWFDAIYAFSLFFTIIKLIMEKYNLFWLPVLIIAPVLIYFLVGVILKKVKKHRRRLINKLKRKMVGRMFSLFGNKKKKVQEYLSKRHICLKEIGFIWKNGTDIDRFNLLLRLQNEYRDYETIVNLLKDSEMLKYPEVAEIYQNALTMLEKLKEDEKINELKRGWRD
ncbi:metalloprotease family protein [Methanocaldococcus sp.]|uniref:metalloprotease family protein n=1 Tax=Methanocaldococcus sp. TaxID=2152917 RepID=UPI00262E97B1|nr:metalloprotease family protein [Methanocaldococcus sp.]MCQ6254746.1 metalloprotease family protein [Methanocaldococcus sp.]